MKPCAFDYIRAETADHACALLAEHGDEARLLAGGQSLIPMMNLRLARPAMLVDIGRLPLGEIAIDARSIRIGALTRHRSLIENAALRQAAPVFAEAARYIAHPTIRRHGTSGGSVAHADPTAEIPGLLALMDGQVEAASQNGVRKIPAREFFRGAFDTGLKPGEMIVALHFTRPAGAWGSCFLELAEREGDFALAAVGVVIERSGERVTAARIMLLGAESVPVRAAAVEASLIGTAMTEAVAAEAGAAVAAAQRCYADIRATAGYRKHLLGEFTRRALLAAYARAGGAQ
jgi:carbon-monoxide dehydrogenase medium subunit